MPDDKVQPSLADEMEREAERLSRERKTEEDQQKTILEEQGLSEIQQKMDGKPVADRDMEEFEQKLDAGPVAAEQASADGEGVDAFIDLDHTQEQQAASVKLTEVSDISGGPKEPMRITDFQEDQKKDCGLPSILMDRKRLIAYLKLHSVTGKMRRGIEYTVKERNYYDRYQKMCGESESVGKDHFVSALRMFKAGLPLSPASEMNLNAMKVS